MIEIKNYPEVRILESLYGLYHYASEQFESISEDPLSKLNWKEFPLFIM